MNWLFWPLSCLLQVMPILSVNNRAWPVAATQSLTCGSCGYPQGTSRPQLRDVRRLDEYNQTILRKLKDLGSVFAMSEEEDKQKWLWKMVSSQLNPYILICLHKILIFLTKNYGELKSL